MATYYQKNKQKILEYQKQYNAEHKSQIKDYYKQYYENNKDFFIERARAYQDKKKPERKAKRELNKELKIEKEFEEIKNNLYWELVEKKDKDEIVVVPFHNIKKTSRGFVLEW